MSKAVATKVEALPPVADETSALISMIERAARDPAVDINKMERLFEMHERAEKRRSEQAFNAAMAAAQAELRPVVRKLNNSQTNSKYADLAAISETADPIIHKHGLGIVCSEFQSSVVNHIGVRLAVKHIRGYSETYDFNIPLDGTGIKGNPNKTLTHAYASTLTYGRRYAKCAVFDITTKNDTDGNAAADLTGMITSEQIAELKKLIEDSGADLAWVCQHHSIEDLSDMTAKDFRQAKAGLTARLRAKQKARTP